MRMNGSTADYLEQVRCGALRTSYNTEDAAIEKSDSNRCLLENSDYDYLRARVAHSKNVLSFAVYCSITMSAFCLRQVLVLVRMQKACGIMNNATTSHAASVRPLLRANEPIIFLPHQHKGQFAHCEQ